MYSLKEGSRFEDLALMEALSDIIQTVHKTTGMRVQFMYYRPIYWINQGRPIKGAERRFRGRTTDSFESGR